MIVNYIEPELGLGHYAVVIHIDEKKMILANPDTGEQEEWIIKEFEQRWVSRK